MDKIWDRKSFEVGGHWPLWPTKKIGTDTILNFLKCSKNLMCLKTQKQNSLIVNFMSKTAFFED